MSRPVFWPGLGGLGMPMGRERGWGMWSSSSSSLRRVRKPGSFGWRSSRGGGVVVVGLGGGGLDEVEAWQRWDRRRHVGVL